MDMAIGFENLAHPVADLSGPLILPVGGRRAAVNRLQFRPRFRTNACRIIAGKIIQSPDLGHSPVLNDFASAGNREESRLYKSLPGERELTALTFARHHLYLLPNYVRPLGTELGTTHRVSLRRSSV